MSFWAGKTVLITGGTGSIGNALAPRLLALGVAKVIVFSRDELKQHEMRARVADDRMRFFLGDVRDEARLRRAFCGVDAVIHAAAIKQVTACEYNPDEAVATNVLGSRNVVHAAIDAGVGRAVLISSDKAVAPLNLYGATKLLAERMFVHGSAYAGARGTVLAVVRYGNVLASRGSVVQVWRDQVARGEPITITDPAATRFWWTLLEAAEFVLARVEDTESGEIHVPLLGAARIETLADAVAPDAERRVSELAYGEKLHECLTENGERSCWLPDRVLIRSARQAHDPRCAGYYSNGVRRLTVEELRRMLEVA